jgi:hypothetical protein
MGYILDDIQVGASASSGARSGATFGPVSIGDDSGNRTLLILAAVVAVAIFLIWRRK